MVLKCFILPLPIFFCFFLSLLSKHSFISYSTTILYFFKQANVLNRLCTFSTKYFWLTGSFFLNILKYQSTLSSCENSSCWPDFVQTFRAGFVIYVSLIYLQLSVSVYVCVGLAETEWLGRTQTLLRGSVTYFLDGAHTTCSMQSCVNWFSEVAAQHEKNAMQVPFFFF